MNTTQGFQQWQTMRYVTAEDTALTDYKPADVTATVKGKMTSVHPATVIAVRFLGKGDENDTAIVLFSGWMHPDRTHGPGPGHRFYKATVIMGSKSWAGIPLTDGAWGASATWREADTITSSVDHTGAQELVTANQESILLLPTLGYSHLLLEVLDIGVEATEVTTLGVMWRPFICGEGTMGGVLQPVLAAS